MERYSALPPTEQLQHFCEDTPRLNARALDNLYLRATYRFFWGPIGPNGSNYIAPHLATGSEGKKTFKEKPESHHGSCESHLRATCEPPVRAREWKQDMLELHHRGCKCGPFRE